MELTQLDLDRKIGGQAEYRNSATGSLYRGEIKAMWIEGCILFIDFNWLAKMEEGTGWHATHSSGSAIDLSDYSATQLEWHAIFLFSWEDPVTTTLFSPINGIGGREEGMLDPTTVRGLNLA